MKRNSPYLGISVYNINRAYFFYPLLVVFMCIDIYSSFGLGRPLVCSLLCLYCVAVSHKINSPRLLALFGLLGIESFFFYGLWGIQLIYLIPLALIARKTWDKFTSYTHHALFMLVACLIAQLIIDLLLGTNIFSIFTILKFFINIVLTISLSLTYK